MIRLYKEENEYDHPYVGKKIIVTAHDVGSLYYSTLTVTRAYDSYDGVVVRHDFENGNTITLKPGEYKLKK